MPSNTPLSLPLPLLSQISTPLFTLLSQTPSTSFLKSHLESLLSPQTLTPAALSLSIAAIASSDHSDSPSFFWIPKPLSSAAKSAFADLATALGLADERQLAAEVLPEVLPRIKEVVKESAVDESEVEFSVAVGKPSVDEAVVAVHQFRWLITQVGYPHLGKLCPLVVPCALTALDHWSPEVKEQGMHILIHIGKNVNTAELGWYDEPILDACCRNIASSDELWQLVVEMSVLLLTCTQRRNPRSYWFERMLTEMLSHLERQPLNRERRIAWLLHIEPVFDVMGLVLLAHFRRIFSLLFQWMHADDDRTVLLVMERLRTIIKLTWIRKSPQFDRLIDELILLYKEAATRKSRKVIRDNILQMLILLQKCKGLQFETAWEKHKNDPDITMLVSSFGDQTIRT